MKVPISVLQSRMQWSCGIIRERAIRAWGSLIANDTTGKRLAEWATWYARQRMEVHCVDTLLVLVYAQRENVQLTLPPPSQLESITKPSLLASKILNELAMVPLAPDLARMHSENAPEGLTPDPFFTKYNSSFVPIFHAMRASEWDAQCGGAFSRQWQFEWENVLTSSNLEKSTEVISFWGGSPVSTRVSRESIMGDALRSGWLRALAWACQAGILTPLDALRESLWICPVDTDLAFTLPSTRPTWWPSIRPEENLSLDIIESLRRQLSEPEVPVYARGSADPAGARELEMLTFLAPAAFFAEANEDLHESLRTGMAPPFESSLGSSGPWLSWGAPNPPIPLARHGHPNASGRYAPARVSRGLWIPAGLTDMTVDVTCRSRDVVMERDDGAGRIGRWHEWIARTDLVADLGRVGNGGIILTSPKSYLENVKNSVHMEIRALVSLRSLDREERRKTEPPQFAIIAP